MAHKAKKQEKKQEEDQSLVPMIKEREQKLAELLQQTREACDAEVVQAEQESAPSSAQPRATWSEPRRTSRTTSGRRTNDDQPNEQRRGHRTPAAL